MSGSFRCTYEVDDGYVGKGRHKHFLIESGDIEEDMDDGDLEDLFDFRMDDAFLKDVSPYEKNRDEFVQWAKQVISEREGE